MILITPRLRLIPATPALVDAELAGEDRFAEELGIEPAGDWPPEHHDAAMLSFTRTALADAEAAGWWLYYVVGTETGTPTLVGSAGYKGPPSDGVVEIGYSIVPSRQRRGLATEAARALVDSAWERGADAVVAHTLPHLEPSIGVLRKLAFVPSEPPEPGVLAFTLRRVATS